MKYLLIVSLAYCISTIGCRNINQNGAENSATKITADSLNTVTNYTQYTDSFIDAEQDKIIGNLVFGMRKKDAEREIERFNKVHQRPRENGRGYVQFIGKFEYNRIDGAYENDKLYRISFVGEGQQSFVSLDDAMDDIVKLITQKYGQPFNENDTSLKSDNNENIYWKNRKKWIIGRKNIVLLSYTIHNYRNIGLDIYIPEVDNKIRSGEKHINDSLATREARLF